MRNTAQGATLPPVPFKLIDEEPLVSEVDWSEWDEALAKLDATTADGRAMRLAEMPA